MRYVHDHPGALVHQDHKKLGRIPDGGGDRVHGREHVIRDPRRGPGYDHLEVVVDDHTRLAYVAHVPDESARSASQALLDAAVWFASHGIRIERVLTDNAWAYTRATFAGAIASIDARHKRTRPHRPQTNGKAERFIQTLLREWAYGPAPSHQCRATRAPAGLSRRVQHRTHPYFPRWHHPDGGACEQPPWESHLAGQ